MDIDRQKMALIHRKVGEVDSGMKHAGVDMEWIKCTTAEDRLYALELLRWHRYGKARCHATIVRVFEVVQKQDPD